MTTVIHSLTLGMAQAYLIATPDGLVLLDAGSPGNEVKVMAKMKELGRDDLRLIFITHAHLDHYGSAAAVRSLTGAPIAIHEADAGAMAAGETHLGTARGRGRLLPPLFGLVKGFINSPPTPPDLIFEDGDRIDQFCLNGRLLHTPGHTLGSSSLIVDDEMAFVGDMVTNRDRPRLQRYYAQDWPAITTSLIRIAAEKPSWIYPGHGRRPISSDELQGLLPQVLPP